MCLRLVAFFFFAFFFALFPSGAAVESEIDDSLRFAVSLSFDTTVREFAIIAILARFVIFLVSVISQSSTAADELCSFSSFAAKIFLLTRGLEELIPFFDTGTCFAGRSIEGANSCLGETQ
jgi:hypothetical protein